MRKITMVKWVPSIVCGIPIRKQHIHGHLR
jgi:hypothetical protein